MVMVKEKNNGNNIKNKQKKNKNSNKKNNISKNKGRYEKNNNWIINKNKENKYNILTWGWRRPRATPTTPPCC